ncbi:MAG: GNAT family N-acetyltransferase [Gomphosphaeria aponina SAG 52.96 = DSM 107014]|uniref:GNAT family N-acetyltransferase n=1 Tax=Gomphosphaeria aponina SAG 52.96 = DSM 107014 TaxID=1521640 RepID=A0A941GX26_9CHRO|nr:GNAT family N-acetyltransferase [Gomphosphaeria aponina SAG 52.96 = DSM 107014]
MTAKVITQNPKVVIRPVQYRDLEAMENLTASFSELEGDLTSVSLERQLKQVRRWYGLLRVLKLFPNPFEHYFCVYVAEQFQRLRGLIQVSPINSSRSTWRIDRVVMDTHSSASELLIGRAGIGSQLLRYCFETIWEARTWILEVNINQKSNLGLYRQNGFQPLAQMTYWSVEPEIIQQLAVHDPDLPNLLPISNADAQLLYQLDTVSMPPLLRQVFDRHIQDFKTNILSSLLTHIGQLMGNKEVVSGYVFEPQRKAAIGYFRLELCKDGSESHQATLTVHPAYTWLYPRLLGKMAQIVEVLPPQCLELASADYQPEREEYLEKIGAARIEHTLLMSRSVWHKLKESRALEGLQLSDVLQGLQTAPRTPIPNSWMKEKNYTLYNKITKQNDDSNSVDEKIIREAAENLDNSN